MILSLLLAAQAPATAPRLSLADNAQLSCMLIGPGDGAPTAFDLDFRSKKQSNALLAPGSAVTSESPLARVSATSDIARRPDGVVVIGFATGNGQYRLDLTPQRDSVRLRMSSIAGATRATEAQGFCRVRAGKPLKVKASVVMGVDSSDPSRPWQLAKFPSQLPDGTCRALTPDGRVAQFGYQVTRTQGNELWTSYRFPTADLVGATAAIGSGTQFHLTAPTEHMVATTVSLGGTPPTFIHITYERMGNFMDLSRGGEVFAIGECGQPLAWVAAAPGAAR